jgi:cytochrome b
VRKSLDATRLWLAGEDSLGLHEWAGYGAAALIALRVVWGFFGTRYARFT